LVAATPFNVNISVDAPSAEIHDFLRGSPGSFEKLSNGIQRLIKERDKRGAKFPIIIKPTINARNFRHLPDLVEWTQAIGASAINMQPMDRWTQETYDELWIEESDLPELEDIVERLIHMKQNGAPILTPNSVIALLPNHFRNEKAPPELSPCRIGLQEFFIRADGSVQLCMFYPTVGNVKEQSARDIWYGHKAKEIREQTVACERLCLLACTSQKTLSSKMKMGLRLLNS
jgi:MoaA/NifB/PqqE/SkfB family radical SAM enzyme